MEVSEYEVARYLLAVTILDCWFCDEYEDDAEGKSWTMDCPLLSNVAYGFTPSSAFIAMSRAVITEHPIGTETFVETSSCTDILQDDSYLDKRCSKHQSP